jgi:hypothetical protein
MTQVQTDEHQKEKLLEQIRAAGEKHQARCAEIKAEGAEPWIYEALAIAYAFAGEDDPDDKTRSYAESSVATRSFTVEDESDIDVKSIGESVGQKILDVKKTIRDGAKAFAWLRPNPAPWNLIRADIGAAWAPSLRAPTLEMPVLDSGSGEPGIRAPAEYATSRMSGFQDRCIQPLCHPSETDQG